MIAELRQSLQKLQRPAGLEDGPGALPLGVPAIDLALGGGFARGALHEISAAGEAHVAAAAGFAIGLSSFRGASAASEPAIQKQIQRSHLDSGSAPSARPGMTVWIAEDMALAESGAPYGPGLETFGLRPERLLTVAAARTRDLLWAMEEALRCRAVHAVIGELRAGELDGVAVRRLSLAAGESGALALLLRAAPSRDASTAATRWIVGAAPSLPVIPRRARNERTRNPETDSEIASGFRARGPTPASRNDEEKIDGEKESCFAVRLMRNRRGPLGAWTLQWSDDDERFVLATHAQPVATPAADRPHRAVA
jgi:protein ImuA